MNLGELLDRAYDVLSDDKAQPRYERAHLVDYINKGIAAWRFESEDKWFQYNIQLVAGSPFYTLDPSHMRTQRMYFEDSTMEPSTALGLQADDYLWETRVGVPWRWTHDNLAHNQVRFYPVPNADTAETFNFDNDSVVNLGVDSQDDGLVASALDSSGTYATITTDPLDPAHSDPDNGVTIMWTNYDYDGEDGTESAWSSSGTGAVGVWATERPELVSGDGDTIAVRAGYELAPLWYALWQTYLEEGDHYDSGLAGFYRGQWDDMLARYQERRSTPLPNQVHVLGGAGPRSYYGVGFGSSMVVDGVTVNGLRWGIPGRGRLGD